MESYYFLIINIHEAFDSPYRVIIDSILSLFVNRFIASNHSLVCIVLIRLLRLTSYTVTDLKFVLFSRLRL